jgi:RNA polymerase sigma-70 factor, ECF subfamily
LRQFEEFYRSEHAGVFRAAFAFCGNRELAQDSTQEAFSRALARWPKLEAHPWAGGWVMTTAFNACRKHLRRRRPPVSEGAASVEGADVAGQADIVEALKHLPARQRQAVILFYLADHPISVVADLMGVSDGAVKSHLSRARESLRISLEVADV